MVLITVLIVGCCARVGPRAESPVLQTQLHHEYWGNIVQLQLYNYVVVHDRVSEIPVTSGQNAGGQTMLWRFIEI
jgi:predicted Ser/Thr protein kinase